MGDLRDFSSVKGRLTSLKPDIIIHLAAIRAVAGDDSWTLVAQEQQMLSNLAFAMPTHCRLIYTGSMAEYGRSGHFSENDQCTPDTVYGCAKFGGTNLALSMRSSLNLDIRVARLFGVFGPGEGPTRLLPSLVNRLLRGESVALSDGLQLRDFVHVDDVCALLCRFAQLKDNDIAMLNIGTGVGVTVRHVCETVADVLGIDRALLRFGAIDRRHVDQDCLVAAVGKLSSVFGTPIQRWLSPDLAPKCVAEFRADPPH